MCHYSSAGTFPNVEQPGAKVVGIVHGAQVVLLAARRIVGKIVGGR